MGGFFDEQTDGGQRQGRLKCSYYLGPERERAGEEGEEEEEVGVEAVKPEMEKARMADDDGRRAAEEREGRTRGRPLLTFPANVSRHGNDLAAAAVSAHRSRPTPTPPLPKGPRSKS